MLINLYGYLAEDFVGRLIVVDDSLPVAGLAEQAQAWGPDPYSSPILEPQILNEQGVVLDPVAAIRDSGLTRGAIFHVEGSRT